MKYNSGFWILAAALSGCAGSGLSIPGAGPSSGAGSASAASAPAESEVAAGFPEVATGAPAGATAVVESSYKIDGAILPVVRGQSRVQTRADMRRTDSILTFDNWLLKRVAGDGRRADIVRVDRKLVWGLEPAKRLYTECPITGCATPGRTTREERSEQAEPSKQKEPDCPVTVRANDLKVAAGGERKVINTFATERQTVTWTVELSDQQGRRNVNKIVLDLWNAPETGSIKEVQAVNETFQRRYVAALNSGENPIGRYVPREVIAAMSALMKNMNANDTRTLSAWTAEMRKVHGYPIMTSMSWTSDGSVCSDSSATQSPQASAAGGLGALSGLMSGMMSGGTRSQAAPSSGTPAALVTYESEVKTLKVMPISDGSFVPPADYQRKD